MVIVMIDVYNRKDVDANDSVNHNDKGNHDCDNFDDDYVYDEDDWWLRMKVIMMTMKVIMIIDNWGWR